MVNVIRKKTQIFTTHNSSMFDHSIVLTGTGKIMNDNKNHCVLSVKFDNCNIVQHSNIRYFYKP